MKQILNSVYISKLYNIMLSCNDSDFVDYLFEVSYQAKGGLTLAECRYLVATKQVTLAADCSLLPLTYFKA